MKVDLKARLRNKYFWVSMISLVVLLLNQLGVQLPIDINEIGGTILSMAVLLGIVVDNGSQGFSDKEVNKYGLWRKEKEKEKRREINNENSKWLYIIRK